MNSRLAVEQEEQQVSELTGVQMNHERHWAV
jgi:hypothetical protein